jgi:dTDP-4-amino-4,6-dideoxygalactose transaminase
MKSLDVKPGDEVIVPAHSWISTSETVTQAGGVPVFCDTESARYTIDPQSIKSKITHRTVGIIPVHLFGQPADMDTIMEIADRNNLWVIEDCAQAHFATYKGRMVGSFGTAASYSFYPGKNLGAMGDAGALTTSDELLASRMAMFARHGGMKKGDHQIEGINSRLDGLQAAILSVKLKYLSKWTESRRRIAQKYNNLLSEIVGVSTPTVSDDVEHVYHLYVIQHENRDALAKHLACDGIQTVINYRVALPFLPAYKRFNHKPEDFPTAFRAQSRILSLPIYPHMSTVQLSAVVDSILRF